MIAFNAPIESSTTEMMTFHSGTLAEGDTSLCAFDQLPNNALWFTTSTGCLAHFGDIHSVDAAVVLGASVDGSVEWTPDRLVSPRQPLGFVVGFLKVHPSEELAILAGYVGSRPHLAIASLHHGNVGKGRTETYNHVCCQGDFIFNRPGMILRQLSWWPGENSRFFVVLSGNCLAVYDAYSVSVPYATHRLHFTSIQDSSDVPDCGNAVSFSFLRDSGSWSPFALSILLDDGAVFVLCPVSVPGISFAKSDIRCLLTDETGDLVKTWHRSVFSRTQLNEGSTHGESSGPLIIQSRSPGPNWRHPPALQGPVNSISSSKEKAFHSLLSLGNGITAIASTTGRILLAKIHPVSPILHTKEVRAGAPHVFVLQDCPRVPSTTELQVISEIRMPPQRSLTLHLAKNEVLRDLILVTDRYLSRVDYSDPKRPCSTQYQTRQPCLGCITSASNVLVMRQATSLQIKCNLLGVEQICEYQSEVRPALGLNAHDDKQLMETEEDTLQRIQHSREDVKLAHHGFAEICRSHDKLSQQAAPDMEWIQDTIQNMAADAAATQTKAKEDVFAMRYNAALQNTKAAAKELGLSAAPAVPEEEWTAKFLKDLGVSE